MTEVILDLLSPLGERVLKAKGVIESGQIANMRTYRLARDAKTHVRLLGEDRTLCGRSLRHNGEWAWQFIHRGTVGQSLPSGSYPGERDACAKCARNPAIAATAEIVNTRRRVMSRGRAA